MKFTRIAAIAVALALVLGACGDSSESSSSGGNSLLVRALAEEIAAPDDDGTPSPFPIDDAMCASEKILDDIGIGRLAELGITAEQVGEIDTIDFSEDELNTLVNAFGDCSDLSKLMGDQLAADGTLSQADADCFAKEFDESLLLDVFKATFRGEELGEDPPDDFLNEFIDVAAACDIAF